MSRMAAADSTNTNSLLSCSLVVKLPWVTTTMVLWESHMELTRQRKEVNPSSSFYIYGAFATC